MSEFQSLKEECCEANKRLPALGIVDLTFGNVSVADRSRGVFAIKPSGVAYEALRADDIVVLRIDGAPDENHQLDLESIKVEGSLRPSSDTPTHMRLFQAFPDIQSIVHTHSRNATAYAQAGSSIPCMGTTHADYFHGDVPVTRPITPEEIKRHYEWETANVIIEAFEGRDPNTMSAVLFHGHAPFVWGPSGVKAVENAFALEVIAEMTLKAQLLKPNATTLSKSQLDKHYFRKHGAGAYYGQA